MNATEIAYYSKHWTQRDKERARLEAMFPLFTFHWSDETSGCYVETSDHSKQFLNDEQRKLEERLTTEHRLLSIATKLSELYPFLKFLALEDSTRISISAWVIPATPGYTSIRARRPLRGSYQSRHTRSLDRTASEAST